MEKGEDFVRLVDENGFAQGSRDLIGRYDDKIKLAELNRIANTPENFFEKYSPFISSYTVNRLGTNAIGDLIRSRLGRSTRFWNSEEKSEE